MISWRTEVLQAVIICKFDAAIAMIVAWLICPFCAWLLKQDQAACAPPVFKAELLAKHAAAAVSGAGSVEVVVAGAVSDPVVVAVVVAVPGSVLKRLSVGFVPVRGLLLVSSLSNSLPL